MSCKAASGGLLVLVAILAACTGPAAPAPTAPSTVVGTSPYDQPLQATVARRDFQIAYQLNATTYRSTAVPLAIPEGAVWADHVADGTTLTAGQTVGHTSVDPAYQAQLARSAATSRIDAARLRALPALSETITAPVAGAVKVADGQISIQATGIDVVASLTGIQQLRLTAMVISGEAGVETVDGQRSIGCQSLWTVPTDTSADPGGAPDAVAATLHCRLPQVVQTAPALRASLHVASPVIPDAVVVPDTMLGYDATGYTVTVRQDGTQTVVPVDVGPSDGVVRVITTPLPVGAQLVAPANASP